MADVEADESMYANLLFSNKTPSGMHPKMYIKNRGSSFSKFKW